MEKDTEDGFQRRSCFESQDKEYTGPKNRRLTQIIHDFAGYTTAHGLNRLVESPSVLRKFIWTAFCLGALGTFLFQTYGLFQLYLRRPVATTLTVEHREVGFKIRRNCAQ